MMGLLLFFDWCLSGSDEGQKVNWSKWCPVHRQWLAHLMEVRGWQLVRRQGRSRPNGIALSWGLGKMGREKAGEQICCSVWRWPWAHHPQTIIMWLLRLPLLLQQSVLDCCFIHILSLDKHLFLTLWECTNNCHFLSVDALYGCPVSCNLHPCTHILLTKKLRNT